MPRSQDSRVQPKTARETSPAGRSRGQSSMPAWTKRLSQRVLHKPDGRYLIYYEKV
jgi:hypothetical protein